MNYFFLIKSDNLGSKLQLPRYTNYGEFHKDNYGLFSASIYKNRWLIQETKSDDDYWFEINSQKIKDDKIFFIASKSEAELIHSGNKLIDLNTFTDSTPDFRGNLEINNSLGGLSSYQAEYPFRMTKKLGTLYSETGLLTHPKNNRLGVFIKNIYYLPIREKRVLYLFNSKSKVIVEKFDIYLNETNFIDLTPWKENLHHCFIFAKDFLGIPLYVIEYSDGSLSIEHTHPPHSTIHGDDKWKYVNKIKNKAYDEIFT